MADSEAVYFGAIWTEDKDTPSGSIDVEKLVSILETAQENGEERIYFSVFENERKEAANQPDINLVHYPSDGSNRGGGKKKSKKSWGSKSTGSKKKGRNYGGSKKSSLF